METISNTPESVAVPDVGTRFINDDNERLDDDIVLALHLSAISPGASVEEKVELLKAIPGGDVPGKAASVFPSNELVPVVKRRPNRYDFWRGINAVWNYSVSLGTLEFASESPLTSLAELPVEKVDEDGND